MKKFFSLLLKENPTSKKINGSSKWQEEEDVKLIELVSKHGKIGKWYK